LSLAIENNEIKTYRAGQLVNIPKGVSTELGNRGKETLELFVVKHEYEL
jgi:mannose-6-phosphate isomerase-like protein (cupin superfamily)